MEDKQFGQNRIFVATTVLSVRTKSYVHFDPVCHLFLGNYTVDSTANKLRGLEL